jgi:hypothetical protein
MGLCSQIHDNVPKRWIKEDRWKYPFTLTQLDTIKGADQTFRFDVQDIVTQWNVVEMICEGMDLVKELEELKQTRAGEACRDCCYHPE